jgi:seryl-tRNA synthetase
MDNNEASRKKFEKAMSDRLKELSPSFKRYNNPAQDQYIVPDVQAAWIGWQSAQQQSAGEIAELKADNETLVTANNSMANEIVALEADNERLREAFKELAFIVQNRQSPSCQKGVIDKCRCTTCVIERGNATTSQSLQAHDEVKG